MKNLILHKLLSSKTEFDYGFISTSIQDGYCIFYNF